uniref:RGS domain-containing protein n=1 Tax=Aplanochytrium stocchinoi TaxID=215587 RepID=A0A7S3PPN6_9STRA
MLQNYYFWREATLWKKTFRSEKEHERLFRFRFLVQNFIDQDAIMRINIPYEMQRDVMGVLNGEKPISENVFDKCVSEVYLLMLTHSWPRFMRTDLYRKNFLAQDIDLDLEQ